MKKLTRLKMENAQTMVEFAIVFPIVLLITYGLIEFGRMVFIYTAVTGSAREGARYGATALNYKNCNGILKETLRGAILIPIDKVNDITIWYDSGPNTPHLWNTCPPIEDSTHRIKLGDRIGVHVIAHYSPIIPFLGLKGFDIVSENARSILVNIKMSTPTAISP